jgi:hypothetical protein
MLNKSLIIDSLLEIDDTGMPKAPGLRQLLDRDIRELYQRDKTQDKSKYIQECIVIYYLGDPKSPAKQAGLSDPEALVLAIQQAGLKEDYIPDELVVRLIQRYYNENITEAGRTLENLQQIVHNMNLAVSAINNLLNEKLNTGLNIDNADQVMGMMDSITDKASQLPKLIKSLEEAKQNLIEEKNTEIARGGGQVLSSMKAGN